ncbi:MAG: O-antigen ligase family protein [Bacteroidaceae bacterium]|jgi:tetratricopeptide (TPR) repeat protein
MKRLYINSLLVLVLSLYCGYETILGLYQFLGILRFNHSIFALTGSFNNPGPYAGFLSVCISLFIAYCFMNIDMFKQKRLLKVIFWLVAIDGSISIIILSLTQSRSAMLALGFSMALLFLKTKGFREGLRFLLKKNCLVLFVCVTLIGIGAYFFKKPSADGRLFMDKICVKAVLENGWKGTGLGKFGGAFGRAQADYFKERIEKKGAFDLDWSVINEKERMIAGCPDNAFNEYLFIGVETGPIVMLLVIGIVTTAVVISFKRGTIWFCGMVSFSVFAFFSYPLHVMQMRMLFSIILGACLFDGKNSSNIGIIAVASVFFMILTFLLVRKKPVFKQRKQINSSWMQTVRWHENEYYEYVIESCEALFEYMKHDSNFLFSYGQSLNKTGQYEKSDSILKMGTEISSDPMFWNVMGNNSLALGRYREAEGRYKHAFYMVPNRLYPLNLLAKLYHAEGDTVRFLDMADNVELFVPKVESVNTERLRSEIRELKSCYISSFDK